MGMDVIGDNPISERGEYFRNNVWWWRPLWDYCCVVAPELCLDVSGHYNDGDGLDGEGSVALAKALITSLSNGFIDKYIQERNELIANLPMRDCDLCHNTGIRTDEVGVEQGMALKVLEQDKAIILGREIGWCNGCDGRGWNEPWETSYPFSRENIEEFCAFLQDCGGFSIC
jgi:hypothetical protein